LANKSSAKTPQESLDEVDVHSEESLYESVLNNIKDRSFTFKGKSLPESLDVPAAFLEKPQHQDKFHDKKMIEMTEF